MATCLITPSQLPPPADRHRYAAHSNVMSASELKLPYARPRSLTDPFCDHTPDHLASLLATPDRDLKWHDFQCLLGPFLPAGTYEESAYFLPLAFDYILTHDDDAFDLVTSLVWFASEYASQLQRDNSLDAVRTKLKYCIDQWTGDFTILHFDHDACREKGWRHNYFDYIRHSETVMEATNDLIRFKVHDDLAITFFGDIAAVDSDPVKSAWFLESARAHVSRDVRHPPRHPQIHQLLDDEALAIKHSTVVRDSLPSYDPAATYWRDTFTLLGTISHA